MKIAMMGAWNTDSGASIHSELLGRSWIVEGAGLQVFTFYRDSFHGTAITKSPEEEEDYVSRCFTVYSDPVQKFDTTDLFKTDFDIFVAEDLGMLPMGEMLKVFPEIKKRAKTVNVVHDGELSDKNEYFKFDWDHVVCFDRRYYDFLKETYPEEKLSIIPYPSIPLQLGDMTEARNNLGLSLDKKIVLVFGQAAKFAVDTYPVLNKLSDKYDITLLLVSEVSDVLEVYSGIKNKVKFELKIVRESPDLEFLYEYLHASDCMLYNKPSKATVVLASTVFQCMGAGCPIVSLDSNFAYPFDKEVIKYVDFSELENNIIDIFEKGPKYIEQQKAIRSYLEINSAEPVARQFLDLFEKLVK